MKISTIEIQKAKQAWSQLDEILSSTTLEYQDLYKFIGYASEGSLRASHRERAVLYSDKRARMARLARADTEEEMRLMLSSAANGAITSGNGGWDNVRVAARMLSDALDAVVADTPSWALSDEVNNWREMASEMSRGLEEEAES